MNNLPDTAQKDQPTGLMSRRRLLQFGCAGLLLAAGGTAGLLSQTDILDRMQGTTKTPLLEESSAWEYADNVLRLSLDRIPLLSPRGSAVRLENPALPADLLIVHGVDDEYYLFLNSCTHGGRKIDLDADGQLTCSSMGQSTYTYQGEVRSGPAVGSLTTYSVQHVENTLVIALA